MLCPACENESTNTQKCTNCGWEFVNFTEEPTIEEQNEYTQLLNNYRTELYFALAVQYYDNKQYEEVIECCRISCEHQLFENPLALMASAYLELGNKEEALSFANMALSINPQNEFSLIVLDNLNGTETNILKKCNKGFNNNLYKDQFETKEEYASRISKLGYIDIGEIKLLKYDIETQRYEIECILNQEYKHFLFFTLEYRDIDLSIKTSVYLNRDAAKNLFNISKTHPFLAKLKYRDKLIVMDVKIHNYSFTNQLSEDILTWTDKNSGLMWQKYYLMKNNRCSYDEIIDKLLQINNENFAGHNDWRIPSITNMKTLVGKTTSYDENIVFWAYDSEYYNDWVAFACLNGGQYKANDIDMKLSLFFVRSL